MTNSLESSSRDEKDAATTDTHIHESRHQHPTPHDYLSAVENGLIEDIPPPSNFAQRWALKLEQLAGVEARGVERVPEAIRAPHASLKDYLQMCVIWFSANVTMNNMIIGFLGPLLFEVGLKDAMILGAFGAYLGAAGTGYLSTFGPASGNRTMVCARYTMGWWPSKICVLFNIVIMLGYGLIDVLLSGQILSAVNGHGLTVIVGTIVSAIVTLFVVLFGIKLFHTYERYAFIPQVMVLLILIGVAGQYFDTSSETFGNASERAADRMSFFFLAVSASIAWTPSSADFYVYFPPTSNRLAVFACTTIGLGTSCAFTYLIGVGIASGALARDDWMAAYENGGAGALLVEAFRPLGSFGDFCAVIVALGLIANNIPGTYSSALSFQLLGRWMRKLPRIFWTVVGVIIYTVCACAGRNHLFEVFQNFLALLGYFVVIYIAITLEEEFIFRRKSGYDWAAWNDPKKLPLGIAAFVAFCVGWVGAVLGMWQTYFTGPLGKTVGFGIDLGIPLAFSWSALAYPGLRYLELKFIEKDIPTRALVVDEPGGSFRLREVILDEVRRNEVLDLVVQEGGMPGPFPAVFGHEGAGVVRRVGSDVSHLQVGDLVLLSFSSCMRCSTCAEGRKGFCAHITNINFGGARGFDDSPIRLPNGQHVRGQFFGQSSFSELAIVDVRSVVKYDGREKDLSFLAPLGCGYHTGAGTVLNVLKPKPNSSMAVFGLGAVGLAALMTAKNENVQDIIAVDIVKSKLELASSLGATYCVDSKKEDLLTAIRAKFPDGIDFVIDTTGVITAINTGIKALGHAGTLALVGVPRPGAQIQGDGLELLTSCKTVLGSIQGASDPQKILPYLVEQYREGKFPVDKLCKVYPASEIDQAISDIKSGKVIKPVLAW
ncbi:hypothetical protein PV08_03773 [Exophiala spinifera]|uniref:Enoyl reductase (ER) domain-containing protein n=1 Tax=Exophiala spinifera TaxID=91928 RepID=A0A0D2BDB2_9EURO|nr:uncharacterized protein PV08_03773 [Exophiala spinifera]KIW16585.1 hypothetical protein PV08_03773 [Exophiala spinifera]